jgi:spermidine/putrescine ABC transporter ATP-binding subunit
VGEVQGWEVSGLSVIELTIRYGGTIVLERLNLDVRTGEFFVLLGASGSGKTTLLRAIAGLIHPDAGRIVLDGADLTREPPHRRPVNTIFQSYALFPHMNVAENIGFGLRRKGVSRAETARVVEQMLALVQLEGFGGRRVRQLSGGQQQRVALARGLAPNPKVLLLDEPLSALDRGLRQQTRVELAALQRQVGATFILVTHDQEEAFSLADRIGVMQGGKMAQIGSPAELYERPNSRFVAEFVGAANILPATLLGDGATLDVGGAKVWAARAGVAPGSVLLALRPERLRLDDHSAFNRLEGVLAAQSYSGETLMQSVRLTDGAELRVARSLHDGFGAVALPLGAAVTVCWHPDACILLPP